jgi:hypothetical protein
MNSIVFPVVAHPLNSIPAPAGAVRAADVLARYLSARKVHAAKAPPVQASESGRVPSERREEARQADTIPAPPPEFDAPEAVRS